MTTALRLPALAAVLAGATALLTACGPGQPQGAPPSAKQPIAASAGGLLALFDRECLHQRDAAWVNAEDARIRATCDGLLVGDGEAGNCEQSVQGDVAWLVPTTAGSTVEVEMIWLYGPHDAAWCTVSAPPPLRDALAEAAGMAAAASRLAPARSNGDTVWSRAGQPSLTLHAETPSETTDPLPSFDTKGRWAGRALALQRQHPYTLVLRPSGG